MGQSIGTVLILTGYMLAIATIFDIIKYIKNKR